MDRQLFSCPAEVHYDYDEYVELTSDTPKLVDIFEDIDKNHPPGSKYTLSPDTQIEFVGIHDGLNERIRQQHPFDHDRKSILSKTILSKGHGQVVRLAAVHWCMDQALARLSAVQAGNAPEE